MIKTLINLHDQGTSPLNQRLQSFNDKTKKKVEKVTTFEAYAQMSKRHMEEEASADDENHLHTDLHKAAEL